VPSTPKNPEVGVMESTNQFLKDHETDSVKMVGHATTIATNTLLGQVDLKLPRAALITTRGFKDVIEIGRQRRAEVYNLFFQRPPNLVERRYRYEVSERINHQGSVEVPISTEDLSQIIKDLKDRNVSSIAIGFLNSYANPIHENVASSILKRELPSLFVTSSHNVSNEYREFERISTAVVNAVLLPVIHRYVTRLVGDLSLLGVRAPLYIMQSNGGMAKSDVASKIPATIVESGPAAGVIASSWLGEQMGVKNIISFDMGGTTAKAGTVMGRVPEVVPEYEVAGKIHMGRLVKGSGYPVRFPFIDLAECSAGGGTIATSANGYIHVGPLSAGAEPGPACYGKGGTEATITDANLILGRLNPGALLGGDMAIYPWMARKSFEALASDLGVSMEEAAVGVIHIANSIMSKILRIVSVERGYDPRNFTLIAFGGAGPMHACALAEELDIREIIIPPNPGMFSALGLLTADLFHDYTRPLIERIDEVDPIFLETLFLEMEGEGRQTLEHEKIPLERQRYLRSLDLRYEGQGYELNLKIDTPATEESILQSVKAFHVKHGEVYGYSSEEEPVELVNAKLRVIGLLDKPRMRETSEESSETSYKVREVYFETLGEWVESEVLQREQVDKQHEGPSIIEQYDSTTVVYPEWIYRQDINGNLILRRKTK
jgi:N-methylhydantoinase A